MSNLSTLDRWATYKDVAVLALKYFPKLSGSGDWFTKHFEVSQDVEPSEDGKAFARDLEDLGPTFVKIGQLLSTRSDLLPPDWIAALQRLQDDVAPVPMEEIREVVESEIGVRLSKLFAEFDEEPIACASIGQVHRAVLRGSKIEVAVKVQRPGIRDRMLSELEVVSEVVEFIARHTDFGERYEIDRMAKQIRRSIVRELDYLQEASNLERLGKALGNAQILVVPNPYPDFCARGVLTMDYLPGEKVTDLSGVVRSELDGSGLAEALFSAYLKQILVDGFFHADPHPGNVLLTRDRRLALIDLGMVGTLSEDLKDRLVQLLGAVAEGKSAEASKIARQLGTPRDDFQAAEFDEAIKRIVENRQGLAVSDIQVGQLVMQVTDECGKHGLRIPDAMFMIGKMLLNLDLIGKALDPDFNPDQSLRRQIGDIAQARLHEHLTTGSLVHYLTDLKELFAETPSRINQLLDKLAKNELSVNVEAIDETNLLKGFHRVANRITVGLILSALIVGASMLMNVESDFTILGYPGLAAIFFLIAAIGGLILVGRILFGSERA